MYKAQWALVALELSSPAQSATCYHSQIKHFLSFKVPFSPAQRTQILSSEDGYDTLNRRSLLTKEKLIIGPFCRKCPMKIRPPASPHHPVRMCIDKYDTWSAWQVATKGHHDSPLAKVKVRVFIFVINDMLPTVHGINQVTLHRLDQPARMLQAIVCCSILQCIAV